MRAFILIVRITKTTPVNDEQLKEIENGWHHVVLYVFHWV